jgi:hypothetical protein
LHRSYGKGIKMQKTFKLKKINADGKFKISFGEMTATHSENNLIYNIRRVE